MPNYLQMPKQQQVVALLALGWRYRRIQTETGVRRETVGRYDRARQANAAKVFSGSRPPDPTGAGAPPAVDGSKAAKVFVGSAGVQKHPNSRSRLMAVRSRAPSATDSRRGATDGEVREESRDDCPGNDRPVGVGPVGRTAIGGG